VEQSEDVVSLNCVRSSASGERDDPDVHAASLGFDLDRVDDESAGRRAFERGNFLLKFGAEGSEFPLRLLQACLRLGDVLGFLADRPTPRAAVVARPSVDSETARRPISAPSIVAPIETAVCSFCCDACCCCLPTASSALRALS
jgi:hypothetical protein